MVSLSSARPSSDDERTARFRVELKSSGRSFQPSVVLPLASRLKLGQEVTRYLRDALVSGAYRRGTRLGIDDLSAKIGVSTMPVREALITLANEGLLEVLPRRGFRVAPIQTGDVRDSFRVHAFVAGLLAEGAARVIGSDTLTYLKELEAEFEALASTGIRTPERSARLSELNYLFHRSINWVPDATRLRWFLRAATRYVPRHFYEDIPGWIDTTLRDHPRIIEALDRRDAVQARVAVEQHVQHAGKLVLANLGHEEMWNDDADGQVAQAIKRPKLTRALPRGAKEPTRQSRSIIKPSV